MPPSAEAVQARAERAARGDQQAINLIEVAAIKARGRQKLLDDAKSGDKDAQRRLKTTRKNKKIYMRRRRAEEKAKRDAGDPDALARHEREKASQREYELKQKARKLDKLNRPLQEEACDGNGATKETPADDGMSGIDLDDESEVDDDEFEGSDEETCFASHRSPIARSAKKSVRYEEDDAADECDEYNEAQQNGGGEAAVETSFDHLIEGGVALDQSSAAAHMAGGQPSQGLDHVRLQNQQQGFKLLVGAEVVDLCGSDDEANIKLPATRKTQTSTNSGTRVKKEPVAETQGVVKVEEEAETSRERVNDEATTSSRSLGDGTPSNVNGSTEKLRRRRQLELKRRSIQLQREENEVDRELLELED